MKKQIIVINGTGTCGKDTFVNFASKYAKVTNFSSIDKIKEIASIFGYNGEKNEKNRKFLSDLKILSTEYSDFPFNETKKAIETFLESNDELMFIHIREPKEIAKVVNMFGAKTLLIKREGLTNIESNESDKNVDDYNYDYRITNSNLEDLEEQAKKFVSEVMIDSFDFERKLIKKEDE